MPLRGPARARNARISLHPPLPAPSRPDKVRGVDERKSPPQPAHERDEPALPPGTPFGDGEIQWLERAALDRGLLAALDDDQRQRLLRAIGSLAAPAMGDERRLAKAMRRKARANNRAIDRAQREQTGIRQTRVLDRFPTPSLSSQPSLPLAARDASTDDRGSGGSELGDEQRPENSARFTPAIATLIQDRKCYVCKVRYRELHHHYDQLCRRCGDESFAKRSPDCDLSGRIALVTGARVKIGYQCAIMLLRCGARVVATTRFPHDAATRYAAEPDYAQWRDRLSIVGVDLRHTPSVEALCDQLCQALPHLDLLISNACQTVRRPRDYYRHMLAAEAQSRADAAPQLRALLSLEGQRGERLVDASAQVVEALMGRTSSSESSAILDSVLLSRLVVTDDDLTSSPEQLPEGRYDADAQQVDLRSHNSWRMRLAEVPTGELLEVLLINAVAPFVLAARLKPLMLRTQTRDKHIVNVTAMEGQFERGTKTDRHPHTNMAKAALNMLTRTSAQDYVKDGIHMNAIDTGWVTDEDPAEIAERKAADLDFSPPLDIVDGAARLIDPFITGLRGGPQVWGQFLKDFHPTRW